MYVCIYMYKQVLEEEEERWDHERWNEDSVQTIRCDRAASPYAADIYIYIYCWSVGDVGDAHYALMLLHLLHLLHEDWLTIYCVSA